MQKVIFREEYNKYTDEWGFLAIFPEDEANLGRVVILPFVFRGEKAIFEPFGEGDIDYVLRKKIVHKNDERIPMLVDAVERYIDDKIQVVEKVTAEMQKLRSSWMRDE